MGGPEVVSPVLPLEPSADLPSSRRRFFLTSCLLLPSLLAVPSWASEVKPAQANDFWRRPRRIRMQHLQGDKIEALYWSDGEVVLDGYYALSHFMRDRVHDKAVQMDLTLLDIYYGIEGWLQFFGVKSTYVLHSGYRTPRHNDTLEGATRTSQHPLAKAGDGRIPGVTTSQQAKFGRWFGAGGVGWYPDRQFVHIDTGRVRSWRG